MDMFEDEELL
ncbi:hypothetical protein HaLaN_04571, partial [Haematococcus lacustris]